MSDADVARRDSCYVLLTQLCACIQYSCAIPGQESRGLICSQISSQTEGRIRVRSNSLAIDWTLKSFSTSADTVWHQRRHVTGCCYYWRWVVWPGICYIFPMKHLSNVVVVEVCLMQSADECESARIVPAWLDDTWGELTLNGSSGPGVILD